MKLRDVTEPRRFITKLARRWDRFRHARGSVLPGWLDGHLVDEDILVATRWGFRMEVSPNDETGRSIYFTGEYSAELSAFLRAHLRDGQTAWDVGSERGWFTLLMARIVGPKGRVDAFEALPRNRERLEHNVMLNTFGHVRVVAGAVGEAPGNAWFLPPERVTEEDAAAAERWSGVNSGVGRLSDEPAEGAEPVPVIGLDVWAEESGLDALDFVKMDVEGSEVRALLGARKTLERFRPILVVEYNQRTLEKTGSSVAELDTLLNELGYERYCLMRRGGLLRLGDKGLEDIIALRGAQDVFCFPEKSPLAPLCPRGGSEEKP